MPEIETDEAINARIAQTWDIVAAEAKTSVWGYPEPDKDYRDLYDVKYELTTGNVWDGFTTSEYIRKRVTGWKKTTSRHAHTVTRP